jgi:hypothetical protein
MKRSRMLFSTLLILAIFLDFTAIFLTSKRRDWSAARDQLLEMMQQAIDGTYHVVCGYLDLELDLAKMIYEFGGGAALHALHNSPFAFPSRSTIIERRQDFKLCITIGAVKMSDFLDNIETI